MQVVKLTIAIMLVECFVALLLINGAAASENYAILNHIMSYERKYIIHAIVCWNSARIVDFVRSLSENDIMVSINEPHVPIAPHPLEAHLIVYLLDMRCDNAMDVLDEANNKSAFGDPFKWILLLENTSIDYDSSLGNFTILTDSQVHVMSENSNETFHRPITIYKNEMKDSFIIETVSNTPIAARRMDTQGSLITICYVITNNDSINHLSDHQFKEIDTITKVNYVLTNHIVDFLNGSRSYQFENSWGYKNADGTWNGMIGKLVGKTADIGGSPLFFTTDRIPVIDYIAMPTPTRSKFVFRQPKLSYMSNVFVLPFKISVWVSSLLLFFVMILFMYVASKWEWKKYAAVLQVDEDTDTVRPSWGEIFVITLGAMCQQGSFRQMRGVVGRIVILLLFLSFMFLYTSYSANIVALLQSSSSRIKTLSDLLNSRLKLGVHDTVFNRHYFSTATEPVRKAIYEKKIIGGGKSNFMSLDDGVQKIRGGLFAFHMETGVGYKVVSEIFHENEKCGLQEIQYLQVIDPWLAVRKNSTYKEMFKIGFRRLQESGLQSRENSLLYTKKPKCAGHGSNFISVGIVDCKPAMLVLAYGTALAVLVLILEILTPLYYRCKYLTAERRHAVNSD